MSIYSPLFHFFNSCQSFLYFSLSFIAVSIFSFSYSISFLAVTIFFFLCLISVIAVYPLILSKDLNYCLGLVLKDLIMFIRS